MPVILPDVPATETLVIDLTNKVRAREKLSGVKQDPTLMLVARAYAAYLAKTNTFSHTADGKEPSQRAQGAGYRACQIAENLAVSESSVGFDTKTLATQTLEGWLNSPGHRVNLLAPNVTEIGVAVTRVAMAKYPKYIVVQVFGRPLALAAEFQIANTTSQSVSYMLSGKAHTAEPGMSIRHTVCEPKTLEFRSAGKVALTGKFIAEHGKVYTVGSTAGGITVQVKARDSVK